VQSLEKEGMGRTTTCPSIVLLFVSRTGYRGVSYPAIHSWTVFLVTVEYFQKNPHAKAAASRSKKEPVKSMKTGQVVKTKVENVNTEIRVWCESCCIRIAPSEQRTTVRGKTYHSHCYSKLSTKPKN
jgi:hypothetical protein